MDIFSKVFAHDDEHKGVKVRLPQRGMHGGGGTAYQSWPLSRGIAHVAVLQPIIEGYLSKLPRKGPDARSEWKLRYFKLYPDATLVYYAKRDGAMRGTIRLTEDFFVSDHRLHTHGFQVSDLEETYYLAANDNDTKMFWMYTIQVSHARCLRW